MKTKNLQTLIQFFAIVLILSLLFIQCSSSKKTMAKYVQLTADDIKNMVSDQQFIFVATRVNPLRGGMRVLTSEYDVSVKKDSLVSYLPYFGRAYQAPLNPSEGGIQFTSTSFSYKVNPGKKDTWEVTIIPNDFQDVQQLFFTIYNNGTAMLNVTSTYKDPISFNGYLRKINKK